MSNINLKTQIKIISKKKITKQTANDFGLFVKRIYVKRVTLTSSQVTAAL